MPLPPESSPFSRPTPRFSVGRLLAVTTASAVGLGLLVILPTPLGRAVVAAARISLPAALLAMAWSTRGPRQAGWAAALIPCLFSDVSTGLEALPRLITTPLSGVLPGVTGPFLDLTTTLLACGLSGLAGGAVARRFGPIATPPKPLPPPPPQPPQGR